MVFLITSVELSVKGRSFIIFDYCIMLILYFFRVALFFLYCIISWCFFRRCNRFVLHFCHVALLACCNFFLFHFVHIPLIPEAKSGDSQKSRMKSFARKLTKPLLIAQKQPFRGFLIKWCSKNMKQIYRRTPMPMCNLNKVTLQLYWNHFSAWLFSCKFAAYFQNIFS